MTGVLGLRTRELPHTQRLAKSKRATPIKGTYVAIEPFHLQAYADEQVFRFNNRLPMSDGDRFSYLVRKIVNKRLTYAELIGQTEEGPSTEEEVF